MSRIYIEKCSPLEGEVTISTAKNSILPILAASLLTEGEVVLQDVPDLMDVMLMRKILESMGSKIQVVDHTVRIRNDVIRKHDVPDTLARRLRASFLVMGPLLARFGRAEVPLPGGCEIGSRPVDLHLKGFEGLGARVRYCHGYIMGECKRLHGNIIYLDFPSVGGTENIMMAACLADGETNLINAAKEPEVVDLAAFLNAIGAKIYGAGTDTVRIEGVEKLHGTEFRPIPDRIEAGTFLYATAITRGNVILRNVQPMHMRPVAAKLREGGADVWEGDDWMQVMVPFRLHAVDIKTMPWPGYPTDLQAPAMVLAAVSLGVSVISETVFENRFMHVPELERMGAHIRIKEHSAIVEGVPRLSGTRVKATDLRAGASLVLAALIADGDSEIVDPGHIDRGYDRLVEKLASLGACIRHA